MKLVLSNPVLNPVEPEVNGLGMLWSDTCQSVVREAGGGADGRVPLRGAVGTVGGMHGRRGRGE